MCGYAMLVGQIISFEQQAVARLREQLGAVEEANEDLIAFARGHSGAVGSIHAAVLAAIEAPTIDALLDVITRTWPAILGIDFAAIALIVGDRGFRADPNGVERVEAAFVEQMLAGTAPVDVQSVASGHPLFGIHSARHIRAQALIRIDAPRPYPIGLLALGQRAELAVEATHGSELLLFLARVVEATIRRCVAAA